jgi:hypothetical protein
MSNPIVFTGLTLDQANASAEYHSRRGATVEVTGDGTGLFIVEVFYPSAGSGPGGSNGSGTGTQDNGDAIAWGKRVSAEFKAKVIAICHGLGCDPSHLMAAMAFETGNTFSPSVQNPRSGATGLIQFLPSTAAGLGTSIEALARMTAVGQLDYVKKHMSPFAGRMHSLSDVYMSILLPVAVGKPEAHVLFAAPSRAYRQNAGLDANHDDQVTKGEAASKVQAKLNDGLSAVNRG